MLVSRVTSLTKNHCASGAFTILGDLYDTVNQRWNLDGVHVLQQQNFWFVLLMTFLYDLIDLRSYAALTNLISIAWPWMCTRKVDVEIEIVSTRSIS